jgi:hypothetical protein
MVSSDRPDSGDKIACLTVWMVRLKGCLKSRSSSSKNVVTVRRHKA